MQYVRDGSIEGRQRIVTYMPRSTHCVSKKKNRGDAWTAPTPAHIACQEKGGAWTAPHPAHNACQEKGWGVDRPPARIACQEKNIGFQLDLFALVFPILGFKFVGF